MVTGIEVETTNSKEPLSISIKSNSSDITLENILFGELWLCSGQSNMKQPLVGFNGEPTFGSNMAIANSYNP
jgi:sialate O-acetylesterase